MHLIHYSAVLHIFRSTQLNKFFQQVFGCAGSLHLNSMVTLLRKTDLNIDLDPYTPPLLSLFNFHIAGNNGFGYVLCRRLGSPSLMSMG